MDTRRRYPAEAIKMLQMAMNKDTSNLTNKVLVDTKYKNLSKKPKEKAAVPATATSDNIRSIADATTETE